MKKMLLLSLMLGVAPAALAGYRMTPREAVYYWASQGSVKNLKALQKSGYSLDMPDSHGQQAVCEAVEKNDVKAFKTLQKAGANMNVFCLYNVSQEKRYEFTQAYYGFPAVVPVMTESMWGEEVIQQQESPTTIQPVEEVLPVASVQFTNDSYIDAERQEGKIYGDSVVFKPYMAANLFYGKLNSQLVAKAAEKHSYHASDDVPGLALAFGAKISDFRAELAIQGHKSASDKVIDGSVKSKNQAYAAFLNAYYDIPTGMALTPYIGAGVGIARNRATITDGIVKYHNSNWFIAWQFAAGLNYALTDNWVADLGYRYTDYGRVNIATENGVKYRTDDIHMHNVTLGLRYEM